MNDKITHTERSDLQLLRRYLEVPHVCSDPKCPGNINRLKLEAIDEILQNTISPKRLRLLADWLGMKCYHYNSNDLQVGLRRLADAMSRVNTSKGEGL